MGRKRKAAPGQAEFADVGERLLWTRLALGKETHSDMVKKTDMARNTYAGYETGERQITLNAALQLCKLYDLSLDWIYFGHLHKVDDVQLRDRIRDERSKALAAKR
jgi:transcriptional regulator with XRE-family HTH domain